jgi:hypothetical protein
MDGVPWLSFESMHASPAGRSRTVQYAEIVFAFEDVME